MMAQSTTSLPPVSRTVYHSKLNSRKAHSDIDRSNVSLFSTCERTHDNDNPWEDGSVKSNVSGTTSRRSRSTNLSEKLVMTQAKVQAAKARMKYAEKELTLKKKRAEILERETINAAAAARQRLNLELEIEMIQEQKHYAEIKAEAESLEVETSIDRNFVESLKSIPKSDSKQRTKAYIDSIQTNIDDEQPVCDRLCEAEAPGLKEQRISYMNKTSQNDFMQFLLKKDLLLTRLFTFNDTPDNFLIWKTSFCSIMRELEVTPVEELDLLVKWLGPESRKYAVTIRSAYACQPQNGLKFVWERLEERFGAPEMVEKAIKNKLYNFPILDARDNKSLYDLSDLISEIEALKGDKQYSQLFSYYDTSSGVLPIVKKLPLSLREKWVTGASKYKQIHDVPFPPLSVFASFLREMSKIKNDPSLYSDNLEMVKKDLSKNKQFVSARKTEVSEQSGKKCPIHDTAHSLNECRAFRRKRFDERKRYLRQQDICFRCCESNEHKSKDCKVLVKCSECNSERHPTALHISRSFNHSFQEPPLSYGGEPSLDKVDNNSIANKCTQICGSNFSGKSCAKIVLCRVYHKDLPTKFIKVYAILDDQSNRSLARSDLFEMLGLKCDEVEFTLSSCSGRSLQTGRVPNDLVIESLDKKCKFDLPTLLECDQIPNMREEIPTPNIAHHYAHLAGIASKIPPVDENAGIMLLIGRDLIQVHIVQDQRIGNLNAPYAQQTGLGWVIIGETCFGKIHKTCEVNVNKTYLHPGGRLSVLKPCESKFSVQNDRDYIETYKCTEFQGSSLYDRVFIKTKDDEKLGMSIDDKDFLKIMEKSFNKTDTNHWEAPLPFRPDRDRLPNNRLCAERRAKTLHRNLSTDTTKQGLFLEFMDNILKNGHAEKAPDLYPGQECWYLPIFGVFHPQKPNKIRCVFDSSAKYEGVSLNDVLFSGPHLTNNLTGVLVRFRKEPYVIMADLQQMFYSFYVRRDHRDYLRFLWYEDNDPSKPMIEYRMCVHVFGNSPSPAIATYGLRKSVQNADPDVKDFVTHEFYVDDGLTSRSTVSETVHLMKRTQLVLNEHRLRLHKIASNSEEVMISFPNEDLAKEIKDLDILCDDLPSQRSLGLKWELQTDSFTFNVVQTTKPFTKRGVLALVHSIFDPLGFVGPVIIKGRLLLRELMTSTSDWDEPLPDRYLPVWESWVSSLSYLTDVSIPRMYSPPFSAGMSPEVYMYSDASEQAISAVGYLVSYSSDQGLSSSFLIGKCKVAPLKGHTVPRLELCATVLSVELADFISEQIGLPLDKFRFHCDSKVVLGYINNKSRRFHTYVCNRVARLLRSTKVSQWIYVPTNLNPADCGTRGMHAKDIQTSLWLNGPPRLKSYTSDNNFTFPLVEPDTDKEVKPEVKTMKSCLVSVLGTERFSRFSSWPRLVEALARLRHIARSFHAKEDCVGWHINCDIKKVNLFKETERFIIKTVQQEVYCNEIECIRAKRSLHKSSPLYRLDPYIDNNDILRVGGRLRKSHLTSDEKNPVIIPGKHHIATLLVSYHHEMIKHQGRHFTEGAIRSAGLWITGGRRLISSILFKCVSCRKLRGRLEYQKMSDLPESRLFEAPPFTYVGVDAFGPWNILTRRTRGGQANSKRWAILFTCLCIRAIHIEVVDEMSSSAFINALRRFPSIRGKVKEFYSDRGTNFIGACGELKIPAICAEDGAVKDFLYQNGTVWYFNTPHSSHMGGSWERMIGMTRRILESTLSSVKNLSHDVFITLMAEACAIINSRPIVPVSCDSECPEILSPSLLLTFKHTDCTSEMTNLDLRDLYRKQWKQVKHLADSFWIRWRKEYLQLLQQRSKWVRERPNICVGDIVLLRDKEVARIDWPIGKIVEIFPSDDGKVRKVKIRVARNKVKHDYIRPVGEVVVLVGND